VELTYRVEIRGNLPRGIQEELRRRFGDVVARYDGDRTVLSGLTVDQAALRSVLGLLWNGGSELHVVRVVAPTDHEEQGVERQCQTPQNR
jgi:hypothetical protein